MVSLFFPALDGRDEEEDSRHRAQENDDDRLQHDWTKSLGQHSGDFRK